MVSIVIPTYNRKLLLFEAVESCFDQTFKHIEIIIIDDGSTDGTRDLVAEYLRTTWTKKNVQYVLQQNSGASAARNRGLQLARGEYVQFLDSDDLLLPTKIAKQLDVLERSDNFDASCCYCYGRMGIVPCETTVRIGVCATDSRVLITKLCSRIVHGMQTTAPLWRRKFLLKHAGWREDVSLGDDLEFYIRLLADSDKICFIDEELFFVREHTNARLSADQMSFSSLASLILARRWIFTTLQQSKQWDAQNQLAFLGAMRTIYANALQLGNSGSIRDIESWLWELATFPKRISSFQALILMRQIFGRHLLLGIHKLIKKVRPT